MHVFCLYEWQVLWTNEDRAAMEGLSEDEKEAFLVRQFPPAERSNKSDTGPRPPNPRLGDFYLSGQHTFSDRW